MELFLILTLGVIFFALLVVTVVISLPSKMLGTLEKNYLQKPPRTRAEAHKGAPGQSSGH